MRSFAHGALFAEVLGQGPPRILALHGWGRRGSDFLPSLSELPGLAVDLPGFGVSPPPEEVIGATGYADIISEILPEFDGPLVLIGHSFGGRVAICLAARHPDHVSGVILTGAPLVRVRPPSAPTSAYRLIRRLNELGLLSDARLEKERGKRGSADYRAATGVMRDILVRAVNESYEGELAQATMPVALLWGEDDSEVPVEVAVRVVSLRGDLPTTLEVLPGVGHLLPLQAPDALRRVATGMLR